jgi:hypothetical protein
MSAPNVVDAVAIDLRGLDVAQRRALSHALVRGQIRASIDFAAFPPSRGSLDVARADMLALQEALDADAQMADLGPWTEDVPEGWRELTRTVDALDRLATDEGEPIGPLVAKLRAELVDATGWSRWQPSKRRTRLQPRAA